MENHEDRQEHRFKRAFGPFKKVKPGLSGKGLGIQVWKKGKALGAEKFGSLIWGKGTKGQRKGV